MLLFQGRDNSHNPFGKVAARLALGAETALAPQYGRSDQALGQIVGWFNPIDMDEGPQGGFSFEDVPTGRCGFGVGAVGAQAQQISHFGLNGLHLCLKGGSGHGSISNFRPPVKHQAGLGQEVFPQRLRRAISLNESFKVTQEVGPTELT